MGDITQLCLNMDALGASDLFLYEGRLPAMRKSGQIVPVPDAQRLTRDDFLSFISAHLPAGTLERLQSEKDLDMGAALERAARFRINLSWQMGQLALAIRRIPSGALNPKALGIPEMVPALAANPRGLVLITGATGSGKTTTLACLLNYINEHQRRHAVTIEDPIEYTHTDKLALISQREIGSDTKDFASALKHVVRQNPDAIFIGEIRDLETISTAISAAMTGHFVAATMHTIDVQQTIERIINYFPEGLREQTALDLSYVLRGIVSQRLIPKKDGTGRVPAFEILVTTPLIQRLIASRDINAIQEAMKAGSNDGMLTFNRSVLALYNLGLLDLETAARYASNKDEFMLLVQGMETGIDTLRTYSADPDQGLSIKKLLRDSIHYNASDLLLTVGSPPVVRIDGEIQAFDMPVLTSADTQKLLFSVLNAKQRADFEESRELDFALAVRGIGTGKDAEQEYRFRVNGFYQKGSIASAMRIIPNTIPPPEVLGIPRVVMELAKRKQGLVLVTGPTGAGKSTTLASLVDLINRTRPCHIITIEDPIEFVHKHNAALIEQREVHSDTLSFANALKYVLRQDPDVILVGEMRDPETIATVLTAAETGHLVFATLHTNDVTQSVDRIIDIFPSERQNQVRSQLAACLEAIIAQRLLPRKGTQGGRIAAFEILIGTTAIKAMIRDKKTHQMLGLMETSAKDGMITMEHTLKNLLDANLITRDTMLSILPHGKNEY